MVLSQEELGERLREARERAGLRQEDVADQLGLSSHSVLSKIERGQQKIDSIQIRALGDLYGVSLDDLLAAPDEVSGRPEFVQALRRVGDENKIDSRDINKVEEFCEYYHWLKEEVETEP